MSRAELRKKLLAMKATLRWRQERVRIAEREARGYREANKELGAEMRAVQAKLRRS